MKVEVIGGKMNPLRVKGTTFGMLLRATRLGYGLSDKHQAFVRICDVDNKTLNVTLSPLDRHVPNKNTPKNHYCWWEQKDDDEPPLLDLIPALQSVRRVKRLVSFDIDRETGERITK